ncbi:MAG: hypothetical protein U5R49_24980 [Deltaproteobacteria bacterium]|nr:hypothetical protein [Deltaproteobacteria bacterium]
MKKAIASPLCSAFIIPGLGQIVNGDLKKGLIILGSIFVLFVFAIIRLVRLVQAVFRAGETHPSSAEILQRLQSEDFSTLVFLLAVFAVIYLYSVIDALLKGGRIDRLAAERKGE